MSTDASGFAYGVDATYAAAVSRAPHDVDHEGVVVDGGLHAEAGITCYACDALIHANDWIRRGPKGTRHDACP